MEQRLDAPLDKGVEAQWAVIGSMLIDGRCVGPVMAMLREEDLLDPTCRSAFAAIRGQFTAGGKVDPVLVHSDMGGGDALFQWLRQVMDLTPTAANVMEYAAIVREKAVRWRVRAGAEELLACAGTAELSELTRRAMAIPGLLSGTGRGRTVEAAELMRDAFQRATSREKRDYLPWGLPSADRAMYIEPGDVVVLGGYPSAGKTLLSIQMALSQAGKYRVVYYTLETLPAKMGDRILAHIAQASLTGIKKSTPTAEEVERMAASTARFVAETPITFVHAAHFTVDDIAADALSKRAEIVYIDYVQLVEGEGRANYDRVSKVSRDLKTFALENRIGVVELAQLSRAEKVSKNGQVLRVPPDMSSLRESGQLEQDADAVFLLWRLDEENNDGERVLKLGKNKEGRKFTTVLQFDGPTQTMTDLSVHPKDYRRPGDMAAELAAKGRTIKRQNRAAAMEQVQLQELPESGDYKVPF